MKKYYDIELYGGGESHTPAGDKTVEEVRTAVYEGLGYASMCWSETPKGIFQSDLASFKGAEIMKVIESYAAQQTAPLSARIAELEAELLELKGKFSFVNDNFASVIKENGDLSRNLKAATALLEELGEYMEKRADTVDGETPRPNTEMCYLQSINDLLEKIR